jgi:hyperosmotically inducible periplasmic protein
MPRPIARCTALALAVLVLGTAAGASDASLPDRRIAASIARALDRPPYCGAFNLLAFRVNHGTVTLEGDVYHTSLAMEAVTAVERMDGVTRVINKVQPLPTSAQDEWIRRAVFNRVYTDDFASRYAADGCYRIHVIVRNGHVRLTGVVDSDGDSMEAALRARAVIGTFAIDNELIARTNRPPQQK